MEKTIDIGKLQQELIAAQASVNEARRKCEVLSSRLTFGADRLRAIAEVSAYCIGDTEFPETRKALDEETRFWLQDYAETAPLFVAALKADMEAARRGIEIGKRIQTEVKAASDAISEAVKNRPAAETGQPDAGSAPS